MTHRSLTEAFGFRAKEIVAVVGTGGKTTFLRAAGAASVQEGHSTLLFTTTKMGYPLDLPSGCVELGDRSLEAGSLPQGDLPPFAFACGPVQNGKVNALPMEVWTEFFRRYDRVLIEADGSRRLPLKAWRDFEPVIPVGVTTTVAICPITVIGEVPSFENTMNPEDFCRRYGRGPITAETIRRIALDAEGIGRYAKGRKVFFLNACDDDQRMQQGLNVASCLADTDWEIVVGSLKNGRYVRLERKPIGVVIMASGQGKRMGYPKLRLPFPLWDGGIGCLADRACASASRLPEAKVVFVTGDRDLAKHARLLGVRVVWNTAPEEGQSASIRRGLSAMRGVDGVVFLPADQPFLRAATIARIAAAKKHRKAALPIYGGMRGAPAAFPPKFFSYLAALRGDVGGRQILESVPKRAVRIGDLRERLDIDTPEDYRRGLRYARVLADRDPAQKNDRHSRGEGMRN